MSCIIFINDLLIISCKGLNHECFLLKTVKNEPKQKRNSLNILRYGHVGVTGKQKTCIFLIHNMNISSYNWRKQEVMFLARVRYHLCLKHSKDQRHPPDNRRVC